MRLEDGRELVDGMASWWCAIHGYNVPELNRAATKQIAPRALGALGDVRSIGAV